MPAQIHTAKVEFIDFAVLLHKATFSDAAVDTLALAQQSVKKISSFAMWSNS